jgi:spore coat protein E
MNYREIVTKAVVGKAKKTTVQEFSIEPEVVPNTVLGCWIINNKFNGTNKGGKVLINGSFDVNVWYSYEDDTKTSVISKNISYEDIMNVTLKNETTLDNTNEIIVRSLRQPTVSNVLIKDNKIELKVEKEIGVEIVGNTKVKVSVEEYDDDYEELIDEEIESELESIEPEYLEDK